MWSVPVHRWLSSSVHWPLLDAFAAAERKSGNNDSINGAGGHAPRPGWVRAVVCVFGISIIFHEAVVYVAMKGTCWPFNTFLLTVGVVLMLSWDKTFPVLEGSESSSETASSVATSAAVPKEDRAVASRKGRSGSNGSGGSVGGSGSSAGGDNGDFRVDRLVKPFGSRGTLAVVVFVVLVQISGSIADYAAWLWWRAVFPH